MNLSVENNMLHLLLKTILNKQFGKGDAAYYLYAHVHAYSPSYTDEQWKTLQSITKQCVVGIMIVVMVVQ